MKEASPSLQTTHPFKNFHHGTECEHPARGEFFFWCGMKKKEVSSKENLLL